MIYRYDCRQEQWDGFLNTMQSGEKFEVDKKMFYYWLEVLPPVFMNRLVDLPDGEILANFGFAEGAEHITVFWRDKGRYFGQRTNELATC